MVHPRVDYGLFRRLGELTWEAEGEQSLPFHGNSHIAIRSDYISSWGRHRSWRWPIIFILIFNGCSSWCSGIDPNLVSRVGDGLYMEPFKFQSLLLLTLIRIYSRQWVMIFRLYVLNDMLHTRDSTKEYFPPLVNTVSHGKSTYQDGYSWTQAGLKNVLNKSIFPQAKHWCYPETIPVCRGDAEHLV